MYRLLEKELLKWKNNKNRFPLLIRGARQVGKTYLIEKFANSEFSSSVSINFEAQPEANACFDSLDPQIILTKLQLLLKKPIQPGKTLLFLDEIQNCPKAILAMRYFKEKLSDLHIIGAGSLLEFALTEKNFSFPVGRIQFLYLKPFSFLEYAIARKKIKEISFDSIDKKIHEDMLSLVREYFVVGGMPAAINSFRDNFNLEEVSQIHEILLSTYQADFSKYANPTLQEYLKIVFKGIFKLISENFKCSKIDPDIRAREIKKALHYLKLAGLISTVHCSSAQAIPLLAQIKKGFKIIFLDTGLVEHALKVDPNLILNENFLQFNRGKIYEQFVGQELLAYSNPNQEGELFYWKREKKTSHAEIDYIYTFKNKIIPIEVKSGAYGKLRSMYQFMKEKEFSFGIRISKNPLSFEKNILSVPFYLISRLPELVEKFLS